MKLSKIYKNIVKALNPISYFSGNNSFLSSIIREPYAGAWQRNDEITCDTALSCAAVFSCVTLISQDVGKLPYILKQKQPSGIWKKVNLPRYAKILQNPNHYQNDQQFKEFWLMSKLITGNTYILKQRDKTGNVEKLFILDPTKVKVLVGDYQDIYYELSYDNIVKLNGLEQSGKLVVPASEIVHDRCCPLFHPLVGVSPLYASLKSASHSLSMQNTAMDQFNNGARPGGILTAPGNIKQETIAELKEYFNTNFTGNNSGKIAVVSDGLTFSPLSISAVESELIEQLKWSAETICATFHVPAHKILGNAPTYNNVEALNQEYYSQCLQTHIHSIQELMDQCLELDTTKDAGRYGVELDLTELFRMDTKTRYESYNLSINGAWKAPNEVRVEEDLEPVEGGDSPMIQQQYFTLSDKAKMDALSQLTLAAAQDKAKQDLTNNTDKQDNNNGDNPDNADNTDNLNSEESQKSLFESIDEIFNKHYNNEISSDN